MRPLTLVLPYYENPGMLEFQLRHWNSLPAEVQSHLLVTVVDDGSRKHPAHEVLNRIKSPAWVEVRLYRIKVDVRWNWIACRNLAMHYARTDWRLMTDMDHVVPETTLRKIMETSYGEDCAYRFARSDLVSLEPWRTKPNPKLHPNTWLMTGELFDRIGGYDERFSGHYGSDGEFRDRVAAKARRIIELPEHVVRVPREVIPDASTTNYTRKDPVLDRGHVARIREARGKAPPLRLTFPWERVF